MIDYISLLEANPSGVLATHNGEDVETRVHTFQVASDNKPYFVTSSDISVFGGFAYGQLLANPNVSFCTYPANFSPVLSLVGKVVFEDNIELKARILTRIFHESAQLREMFKTPDNPVVKLFYIHVKKVKTFSFAEGAKTYTL